MEYYQQPLPSLARTVSRLAFGVCIMMLANGVAVAIGLELLYAYDPLLYASETAVMLISDAGMYLLGVPLMLLVCSGLPSDAMPLHPQQTLKPRDFACLGFIGYAVMYLANMATLLGIAALEMLRDGAPLYNAVEDMLTGIPPLASFLLIALLPALGEELLFRGYLYKKLARFGPVTYIFVSALLFSTFHATLEQMLYAFVLGLLFAWITWHTKSVYYGMFLHFIINFISGNVLADITSDAAWTVADVVLMLAVIVGVVLLILKRRVFRLPRQPEASVVRTSLLNPGMITWLCLAGVMVLLAYF